MEQDMETNDLHKNKRVPALDTQTCDCYCALLNCMTDPHQPTVMCVCVYVSVYP